MKINFNKIQKKNYDQMCLEKSLFEDNFLKSFSFLGEKILL